ncbi:hypothetical protein [Chachezhania antarctica]|uniref:hypothetical protein n=1 Tax=Chachezhania antarctica TaxID=2340860 RepID=UPI0013CED2F1|nr:hypothetical protein [Chachezhania antarctica]
MASVIGALRVNLGLDSANFQKGVGKVSPRLKSMRAQFLKVAGAAAAFGAAISAAALKSAQEIDRAAKAARRLDASIGGFRALELAASEAGVPLSGLTNDIQNMNREIANIGTSGNAGRALERLGLTVEDLAGLDADEKIATIADRVKALGLSSGETTALMRDLGVRGREMSLLMIQGGDAIRAARTAVEDYGLALSATDAAEIEKANDRIGRLGYISQYAGQQLALALVPSFGRLAESMTDALREGGALRGVIDAIAGNIVRVSTYVAAAAAAFGVRYVAALAAARIATLTFAGSLAVLRGALIRSGIGLVIVAAGEMVFQFSRLVSAAGSFGGAMSLLGDLAREVGDRIGIAFGAAASEIGATWQRIKAAGLEALSATLRSAVDFGNRYVGVYRGAFAAIKAIWSALPGAIGDLAYQAAQSMVDGVESMLNAVVKRINDFIEGINGALALLPEWATGGNVSIGLVPDVTLKGVANPFAGAAEKAGAAAADAFRSGFETDTFDAPDTSGLDGVAQSARDAAADASLATDVLRQLATSPLAGLKTLKDTIAGTADATDGAADAADRLGNSLDDAGGGGGGAAKVKKDLEDVAARAKEVATDITTPLKDALKSGELEFRSFADAAVSIMQRMADRMIDQAFAPIEDAVTGMLSGKSSGGGGLASIFGGGGGGLGSIFGGGSGGGFFSKILGAIPGFAAGTNSAPGGLAWTGEQGRELVNLPRGSQVIPNHKLGAAMGGAIELILHAPEHVSVQTVRSEVAVQIRRAQPGIVGAAVESVQAASSETKDFLGI